MRRSARPLPLQCASKNQLLPRLHGRLCEMQGADEFTGSVFDLVHVQCSHIWGLSSQTVDAGGMQLGSQMFAICRVSSYQQSQTQE